MYAVNRAFGVAAHSCEGELGKSSANPNSYRQGNSFMKSRAAAWAKPGQSCGQTGQFPQDGGNRAEPGDVGQGCPRADPVAPGQGAHGPGQQGPVDRALATTHHNSKLDRVEKSGSSVTAQSRYGGLVTTVVPAPAFLPGAIPHPGPLPMGEGVAGLPSPYGRGVGGEGRRGRELVPGAAPPTLNCYELPVALARPCMRMKMVYFHGNVRKGRG